MANSSGSGRLRGGYDIDDVQLDFMGPFLRFANKRLGTKVKYGKVDSYALDKVFSIPLDEMQTVLNEFYHSEKFSRLSPVRGAVEGLIYLTAFSDGFDLTARPAQFAEVTKQSLREAFSQYGIPEYPIEFCYHHDAGHGGQKKVDVAQRLGLDFMIEDSPKNAIEIANAQIPVFLLRRPWNKHLVGHEYLIPCEDWDQIVDNISSLRRARA